MYVQYMCVGVHIRAHTHLYMSTRYEYSTIYQPEAVLRRTLNDTLTCANGIGNRTFTTNLIITHIAISLSVYLHL